MTDFVPGIVMALLFGKMIFLALPLRLALQAWETPTKVATQVEQLLVVGKQQQVKWDQVHTRIKNIELVAGFFILEVPSFGSFTEDIKALAQCGNNDLKILDMSGHSEVQVKVDKQWVQQKLGM